VRAGIEPYVALLALAKLAAIGLGDERCHEGECLASAHSADELGAGDDIAPLVRPAHLQLAAVVREQMHKVVALHQLVAELGKGDAGLQSVLHRIFGHHIIDGDVLAYLTHELEETHALVPVVVVHQLGTVGAVLKIEETQQLGAHPGHIAGQRFFVQQVALGRFAARVAYHARSPAHQRDGPVAGPLQMHQQHDGHQIAYVQRVGRGVEAHIAGHHLAVQQVLCAGHAVVQQAAPAEFFNKIVMGNEGHG
jgi:hypothetical protein